MIKRRTTGKRKQTESNLQIALSEYIKLQYPNVIFTAESSGIRLGIQQAMRMKKQRSVGSLPDMIIMEPRGIYHGMALELKSEANSPFLVDGSLRKDLHVIAQARMLDRLKRKGYWAQFIVGIDEGRKLIDLYMSWD